MVFKYAIHNATIPTTKGNIRNITSLPQNVVLIVFVVLDESLFFVAVIVDAGRGGGVEVDGVDEADCLLLVGPFVVLFLLLEPLLFAMIYVELISLI
jgi:hypothetical protein